MLDLGRIETNSIVTIEHEDGQRTDHKVLDIDMAFIYVDNGRKYYINDAIEVRNPFKPRRTSKIVAIVDPCILCGEEAESIKAGLCAEPDPVLIDPDESGKPNILADDKNYAYPFPNIQSEDL